MQHHPPNPPQLRYRELSSFVETPHLFQEENASAEYPRKPPRALNTNRVVAQIKTREPLALPQNPRKPPGSLVTNLVVSQVQMRQHIALPKHPGKPPRALITKIVVAHFQMS
eukprot:2744782-Rhodomonas_salina.1